MKPMLQLFEAERFAPDDAATVTLSNDTDPREVRLAGIRAVVLQFPRFTDGRAFSQAFLLRRRLGFTGDIRATGDVLIDQLLQMQRSGFSQAVLRHDQNLEHGRQLLAQYPAFYQGDAVQHQPPFAATRAPA
jgi:uncharacterized protein (DUF934 family)